MQEHAQPRVAGPARAVQYVRMSSEHRCSTENQKGTIRRFADAHQLEIIRTYSDDARSGLDPEGKAAKGL